MKKIFNFPSPMAHTVKATRSQIEHKRIQAQLMTMSEGYSKKQIIGTKRIDHKTAIDVIRVQVEISEEN